MVLRRTTVGEEYAHAHNIMLYIPSDLRLCVSLRSRVYRQTLWNTAVLATE